MSDVRDIVDPPIVTIKTGRGYCLDTNGLVLRATREDLHDPNSVLVEADPPGLYLGWHQRDDLHWPAQA